MIGITMSPAIKAAIAPPALSRNNLVKIETKTKKDIRTNAIVLVRP
jgi:hypothetical protein